MAGRKSLGAFFNPRVRLQLKYSIGRKENIFVHIRLGLCILVVITKLYLLCITTNKSLGVSSGALAKYHPPHVIFIYFRPPNTTVGAVSIAMQDEIQKSELEAELVDASEVRYHYA